jgi:hypothetical protein
MFGATATIGAFTFMAGTLLLATFEAYVVMVVGTIISAFSALRITHSYGVRGHSAARLAPPGDGLGRQDSRINCGCETGVSGLAALS